MKIKHIRKHILIEIIEKYKNNKKVYFKKWAKLLENNKIWIIPTDTLYWLSSLVTEDNSNKISKIKKREANKTYSIIAPNIDYIRSNFIVPENFKEILKKSLEKYKKTWITFILEKKDKNYLPYLWINNKMWVRILNHFIQDFVNYINKPIITTSANISSEDNPIYFKDIDSRIIESIDFVIKDDINISWDPSILINNDWSVFLKR